MSTAGVNPSVGRSLVHMSHPTCRFPQAGRAILVGSPRLPALSDANTENSCGVRGGDVALYPASYLALPFSHASQVSHSLATIDVIVYRAVKSAA